MNWNGPSAVERRFFASLRPPDSVRAKQFKKVVNDAADALPANSVAIPVLARALPKNTVARPNSSSPAPAKLRPTNLRRTP